MSELPGFWTLFWAQPGVGSYWSLVATAASVAIVFRFLAVRRAGNNRQAPGSQPELTLSSQDTRVRD